MKSDTFTDAEFCVPCGAGYTGEEQAQSAQIQGAPEGECRNTLGMLSK